MLTCKLESYGGKREINSCEFVSPPGYYCYHYYPIIIQLLLLLFRTLKTIQKNGLNATAKKFGIDLDKFAISSGTAPVKELELVA